MPADAPVPKNYSSISDAVKKEEGKDCPMLEKGNTCKSGYYKKTGSFFTARCGGQCVSVQNFYGQPCYSPNKAGGKLPGKCMAPGYCVSLDQFASLEGKGVVDVGKGATTDPKAGTEPRASTAGSSPIATSPKSTEPRGSTGGSLQSNYSQTSLPTTQTPGSSILNGVYGNSGDSAVNVTPHTHGGVASPAPHTHNEGISGGGGAVYDGGNGVQTSPVYRATSNTSGFFNGIATLANLVFGPRVVTQGPQVVIQAAPVVTATQGQAMRLAPTPRDPNAPLTREEIFRLAQQDAGPYAGEGAVHYLPQNTFASAPSNNAVGAYGTVPQSGVNNSAVVQDDPNNWEANPGAPSARADAYRSLSGDTTGLGAGCAGFVSCTGRNVSRAAQNLAESVSGGYRAIYTGRPADGFVGSSEEEIIIRDTVVAKSSCLNDPSSCLHTFSGPPPSFDDYGRITSPVVLTYEKADAAVPAENAIPAYPQDTVVLVCYADNCRYGSTNAYHELDVYLDPESFGAATGTPLSLTPVAMFSTPQMAQSVTEWLNGGYTLDTAIVQASDDTGGRPLYVVPHDVAFIVPLGDTQQEAFLNFKRPQPWTAGTSVLNVR